MSNEPLTLRPHHGMCLAYFTGHGYSGAFSAHMAATLAALTPERPVRLAAETDEICSACPNNEGGLCSRPERVAGYDRAVLDRCGLEEGGGAPFRGLHGPGPGADSGRGPAPGHLRQLPVGRLVQPAAQPVGGVHITAAPL